MTLSFLSNHDVENGFLEVRYLIQGVLVGETPGQARFYFAKSLIETTNSQGLDAGLASLKASEVLPSGILLNRAGFQQLDAKEFEKAKALFTVYIAAYPESADAQDCMGEAHFQAGERTAALECFGRALVLDPRDPYARKRIAELNGK